MTTYDIAVVYSCPHCGKLCLLPNATAIALGLMGSTMQVDGPCKCQEEKIDISPGRQLELPDPTELVKMQGKVTLA